MIKLSKKYIPNKLEITLKNGNFNFGHIIKNNKNYILNPKSNAEKKLFSSHAKRILFEGMHYRMNEDSSQAQIINQEDISENLKYTCVGYN